MKKISDLLTGELYCFIDGSGFGIAETPEHFIEICKDVDIVQDERFSELIYLPKDYYYDPNYRDY